MTAHSHRDESDFVVVANRLPVDLEEQPDGSRVWRRSPGGLVTALEPVLRSRNGTWVGWPGASKGEIEPFVLDGLRMHPIHLSKDEVEGYYHRFSNSTLWPLYHDVVVKPTFDRSWWGTYREVNLRFAEATARAAAPGATVWVHDYQLQLVPAMLRELRPDLKIGFFLHIPFPPSELFAQLPWRVGVLQGMLGADLVGFHLPGGAENFLALAHRLLGLEAREQRGARLQARRRASVLPALVPNLAPHGAREPLHPVAKTEDGHPELRRVPFLVLVAGVGERDRAVRNENGEEKKTGFHGRTPPKRDDSRAPLRYDRRLSRT